MTDLKTIRVETVTSAGGQPIGIVRIARPEALNALNKQVLNDLKLLLQEIEMKPEWRAAIVTGEGEKSFVAGADIKEMESLSPALGRELAMSGQALFQRLEDLPFPTIAAVNGFALGGGLELALACDFIVASNKCKWGLPEVGLGLIPGYGGTQRLSRVVGRGIAKRVALTGEIFTAQQGYEWGLITQLFEPEQLWAGALKIAETIATRAPLSLKWVKEAIHQGSDRSLSEGLKTEAELFGRTFSTKDHDEGIAAFIAKRPPQFQGN